MRPSRYVTRFLLLLVWFGFATNLFSQEENVHHPTAEPVRSSNGPGLPIQWYGTWHGTMANINQLDEKQDVKVVFLIGPIPDSNELVWRITYGDADQPVVKDYKLVPDENQDGRFWINEQNGIKLRGRLVGNVMYSRFSVGESLLTARYELREGALVFEIVSSREIKGEGNQAVKDHEVNVIQTAILKRK